MKSITFSGNNYGLQNGINNGSITINSDSLGRENNERLKILDWLSTNNQNAKQADILDRRYEGTGQWFLQTDAFQNWFNLDHSSLPDKRTLFCYGTQGAGKTTISATVIDAIRRRFRGDSTVGIAFFYCDYRERMTYDKILASLLRQLLPNNLLELKALYDNKGEARPTLDEIAGLLARSISCFLTSFIVIDALDESSSFEGFYKSLRNIFSIQEGHDLRLFVTSRENGKISDLFNGKPCLRIRAHSKDIEMFLKGGLEDLPAVHGRPDISLKIISTIVKAACGMFLLAKLQLQHLFNIFGIVIPHEDIIYAELEKIPSSLEQAFDETMDRINSQASNDRDIAQQVLRWIVCATRHLSPCELQHALALGSHGAFCRTPLVPIQAVVSICAGLVTVDKRSHVIRLDHYTMQEYFVKNKTKYFPDADRRLAISCLLYLSHTFCNEMFGTIDQHEDFLARFPLYKYSALSWGYHAGRSYEHVRKQVECFVQTKWPLARSLQTLFAESSSGWNKGAALSRVSPLHPAAYFGLRECIKFFLERGLPCDSRDGNDQTALNWAVRNSQLETAELLLWKGADVNLRDNEGKTALHHAAMGGDLRIIEILVGNSADVEIKDMTGQTPLLTALESRNFQLAESLVTIGASVHHVNNMHRNALHLSTLAGRDGIQLTDLILSKGASPDLCDVQNLTPLHYAISNGSTESIDSLIKAGVCVNACIQRRCWAQSKEVVGWVYKTVGGSNQYAQVQMETGNGLTPLHWAALIGHPRMVEYLLAKGADPNKCSQYGETPLHLAIQEDICSDLNDGWNSPSYRIEVMLDLVEDPGSEEAVEVRREILEVRLSVLDRLLSHIDINVDMQNGQMETPLHLVTYRSRDSREAFLSLMRKRPNVSIRNKKGQTPLHLACHTGEFEIIRQLLLAGSSATISDGQDLSPIQIHLSSHECSLDVFELLLQHYDIVRDNPCMKTDIKGRNLLHHHVQSHACSEKVIDVLLNHGTDINGVDSNGDSPLSLYLRTPHLNKCASICRHLLTRHASPSWTDGRGRNLAHIVCSPFHTPYEIFGILQDASVDFMAKDSEKRGVIHHAAMKGLICQELIDILRKNGSLFLNDEDKNGQTPLSYVTRAMQRQSGQSSRSFRGPGFKMTLDILQAEIERFSRENGCSQ